VYPLREGRDAFSQAVRSQFVRMPGLTNVIRRHSGSTVLLISGVPLFFNSGDETILGRNFSGAYEAREEHRHWKLVARVPLGKHP